MKSLYIQISFSSRRCPADTENIHTLVYDLLVILTFQNMDTSSPSIFVNGESLPLYFGKRVRAVVQVIQSDGAGTTAKSTDEHQLIIKGLPVIPPLNFVEVIGIADSNQSVNAEIWTDFGSSFDAASYNQLCKLANGEFKALFL
uniref:Replication protein A OB domain-containing protein n=1 Tax=Salix viminalis TaxID=40686 RepID=A0A6N2M3Z8_SALVM